MITMDIRPYQAFFHDGSIVKAEFCNNIMKIWMISAEIIPEFDVQGIQLDSNNSISGCLILTNVKSFVINDKDASAIKMHFEEGEIMKIKSR